MADEPKQFVLENKQLLELLIKTLGVHEGRWSLLVKFGISTGAFGTGSETVPGVTLVIGSLGIQEVIEDPKEPGLILDASEVNPKGKRATPKPKPGKAKASTARRRRA